MNAMTRFLIPSIFALVLTLAACSRKEHATEHAETQCSEPEKHDTAKQEPHRYGGWYCPDNFGFVPVDLQKLDQVPAIANRLPTRQELDDHMSLINVDTDAHPDARALEMDLPRVAKIYSSHKAMEELIIVIQAIVVQEDTVVGYRFVNGGNGSSWISDVEFLSENEVADMGSQPFFYSKSVVNASSKDIWEAMSKTDYFKQLGEKFSEQKFFSSAWDPESEAHLDFHSDNENSKGYVGMVYGNYYLQIDYVRDGFHYSEKMLMSENKETNSTEFFFASGPYPEGFAAEESKLSAWVDGVKKASEGR
ncbi:MAG: hypothetical protein ACPGED_02015, partial [Flavobacteriales bacterium]